MSFKTQCEKYIEDYFNNMTEEDFKQFLIDTDYEYYSKFKCFCMFYDVEESCTWTPDFIDWIDCCPISRGIIE